MIEEKQFGWFGPVIRMVQETPSTSTQSLVHAVKVSRSSVLEDSPRTQNVSNSHAACLGTATG